jgi:glyoxylase-like metal-dependent hydrolase (beta-lactamase superfamily II)
MGNDLIFSHYGLKPEAAAPDQWLMESMARQTSDIMGVTIQMSVPPVGPYLHPTDVITFGSHQFTILPTPGHTPGSVLFYCEAEHVVFSGDTLFCQSIGRTDFDRGSFTDMMNSLRHVVALLPDDTTVYCGHGPQTTIRQEKATNPYLRY